MTVDCAQASAIQRCTIKIHEGKGMDLGRTYGIGTTSWGGSLHPPSRQPTRTSIDHHHPIGSSPTPVVLAGAWRTTEMRMGTPNNMEPSLTPPALRRDLLAWIQGEPRLA